MQVQNISNNQQSFQGKFVPGNLSERGQKFISLNFDQFQNLVKHKNYNLYVTEDSKDKVLKFIVQRARHFGKKNKPIMEVHADFRDSAYRTQAVLEMHTAPASVIEARPLSDENLYYAVAKHAVNEFDKIDRPMTFGEKFQYFIKKIGQKFMDIVQDRDEI